VLGRQPSLQNSPEGLQKSVNCLEIEAASVQAEFWRGLFSIALKRRGLMVCLGTASGAVPPFNPAMLAMKGSLFLTRPASADYIADPAERNALASELFEHVAAGRIKVDISKRYELSDAVQAHRDIEARKIIGSAIFTV
jgi:NADPH2:quinone reductase